MKYCRVCKLKAPEQATACAQCGRPLAELALGGSPAAGSAAVAGVSVWGTTTPGALNEAPVLALQGQIQQLQAQQRMNLTRGRMLVGACLLLAGLLALLVQRVYASTVLVYAVISDVAIRQNPDQPQELFISFQVERPGRVSYIWQSGNRRTEKLDELTATGMHSWRWSWPSDKSTGIDLELVSRGGWWLTHDKKHFIVQEKGFVQLRPPQPLSLAEL